MGLSGVSRWGSDIGGFFSLAGPQLDDELLTRWVQLGAVSGVMRTERDGIAIPSYLRPQVEDAAQIGNWRRYTKLRTQLYPYIVAADREYSRSGLPIMRHLVLATRTTRLRPIARMSSLRSRSPGGPGAHAGRDHARSLSAVRRLIDFWRAVAFDSADGIRPRRRRGPGWWRGPHGPCTARRLRSSAPARCAMLPADVDTLADFGAGAPGLVRLADRQRALQLIAASRDVGRTVREDGSLSSAEAAGKWTLNVRAERRSTVTLQATMRTLQAPFVPCSVLVNRAHARPTHGASIRRPGCSGDRRGP
jgi:hypothetical protein